ncbi:MAG: hypothetical protein ACFBSE_24130 [Prochloraceae cyanobacterium]
MILIDGYKVFTKIYESDKSLIYRGLEKVNNRAVILKLLKQEFPDPEELNDYKKEYEITYNLGVDSVIKAYELKKYQNKLLIIFEDFGG